MMERVSETDIVFQTSTVLLFTLKVGAFRRRNKENTNKLQIKLTLT
jgi:hypothetical protein